MTDRRAMVMPSVRSSNVIREADHFPGSAHGLDLDHDLRRRGVRVVFSVRWIGP